MSFEAMTWAAEQHVKPSSAKFVLFILSNYASGEDGALAYPSLETIARVTSLDRKTIIVALDWLQELGLLMDTGQRKGATKQVKVYRLIGLDTGEKHYVYRVRHRVTGQFYIGVRSTWGSAEGDDKYFGSGEWPMEMRRRKEPLVKDILATFKVRRHAERYETEAIVACHADPLCKNANTGSVPLSELSRKDLETVPLFPLKGAENGTQNYKNFKERKILSPRAADVFEQAMKIYPKRAGNNPTRRAAKIWNARLEEGVDPNVLLAGVARYAAFCEATGKIRTETVMMSATFFGADRPYEQDWALPDAPSSGSGWWSTQEATLAECKRRRISTQGETWDRLKQAVRESIEKERVPA